MSIDAPQLAIVHRLVSAVLFVDLAGFMERRKCVPAGLWPLVAHNGHRMGEKAE